MGRFGGVRDIPAELRDLVTHRTMSRRRQVWEPPTVKAEPSQTWADVRSFAHRALPGCTYRRLPMWRYLIEYEKPAAGSDPGSRGVSPRRGRTGAPPGRGRP
jgi:hypothetical protein